jgi:threonine/homoserine/homoserine lactone efflux protein
MSLYLIIGVIIHALCIVLEASALHAMMPITFTTIAVVHFAFVFFLGVGDGIAAMTLYMQTPADRDEEDLL